MRNPTPNTPTANFCARFDRSFGATCAREAKEKQRQSAGRIDIVNRRDGHIRLSFHMGPRKGGEGVGEGRAGNAKHICMQGFTYARSPGNGSLYQPS